MASQTELLIRQNPDNAAAITPGDSSTHDFTRLWVGGAGNLKVKMRDTGDNIQMLAVPAGTEISMGISRVYSTDTTATNIVGFY